MNTEQPSQTNTQNIDQRVKRKGKQISRRGWARIIVSFSSFLCATMLIAVLNFLSPTIPGRAFPARVGWYLTHGQWRADSRTLAAAWNYYLQEVNDTPMEFTATNGPVAATPTETSPKS